MMQMPIRVRFAPSPTGPLHIGAVRTALFNFLFAKHHRGTFIVRIEDTDRSRSVPNAEKYIMDTLEWLALTPDESPLHKGNFHPYRQSERLAIYPTYIKQLLKNKQAYYAFDSPEELASYRKDAEKKKESFSYNYTNRHTLKNSLNPSFNDTERLIRKNFPYVIRFKIPENTMVETSDLIRGNIRVNSHTLDDKILMKSDGFPTYHLANVVDDYLMKISHVIRGEEWLPSLPLHHLLYKAFGWEDAMPKFAHLPLILKPNGRGKLSKRDGEKGGFPVFPLNWGNTAGDTFLKGFKEIGFYPEALINTMVLLGWHPATDQEIFSMEELIQAFTIENINQSGARFDYEKAKWFNHQYLLKKPTACLAKELSGILEKKELHFETNYLEKICELLKERVNFVQEIFDTASYFFFAPTYFDSTTLKKTFPDFNTNIVSNLLEIIQAIENFNCENIEATIKRWIEQNGYPFGRVLKQFRLALVGSLHGPSVFEIASLLGKEETLKRLGFIIEYIASNER